MDENTLKKIVDAISNAMERARDNFREFVNRLRNNLEALKNDGTLSTFVIAEGSEELTLTVVDAAGNEEVVHFRKNV